MTHHGNNSRAERLGRLCQRPWIPLLLGMITTIAVLGLWKQLVHQEQMHIHQLVQQEVASVRSELSHELSTRIQALERLSKRWVAQGGFRRSLWEVDVQNYLKDFSGYQAIEWVDSSFRVQWVVPLRGNEAAVGLDLSQEPRRQITLTVARDLHQTILTRTISLVQGGRGFLVAVPLFVGGEAQTSTPERFDGFILGVFRHDSLFDSIVGASSRYQVQIYDRDQLIYSQGSIPPHSPSAKKVVRAYGADWQIQVFPTAEMLARLRSPLPGVVLWGGLVGAWTLAGVVYLSQRFWSQTRQVQGTNRQLQREIRSRQQAEAELQGMAAVLQNAVSGISRLDAQGYYTYVNNAYGDITGYPPEEMIGLCWEQTVHPDEQEAMRVAYQQMLQDGRIEVETRGIRRDGTSFYKQLVMIAVWEEQQFQGHYCFMKDISERKQAEMALRQSEEKFRMAIDFTYDWEYWQAPDQSFVYVSPSCQRITGYTPDEFVQNPDLFQSIIYPDDREIFSHHLCTDVTGTGFVEFRIVTRAADIRWIAHICQPVFSREGTYLGRRANNRDVSERVRLETERKQAEEALRQSEATKQAIIQAIPDLLIRIRADGDHVEFISNSDFNLIDLEQIDGNATIHDVLPPDLAQLRLHYTKLALASGLTQMYEQEIIIRGKQCYEEVRVVPLMPTEVLVMVRDITDRQQTEEALRHQKEMFQAIINHLPVMIALFDKTGHIEFVNPELEKTLGWTLKDWQSSDILRRCYSDATYYQQVIQHMLAASGRWQDMVTTTATGQSIETSWANVRLSDGRFLGIGQDISDRKHKEMVLQQAMEAAEAANLAKSTFLANMSHELRTPLNVILGFTQVMARDPSLLPSQREDLQTIQRSGDHLLSLINDVLDLSKIEAGHSALEEMGFDLISLLHTLCTMMTERATAKGLQLICEIAPDVPQFVIADAQKLRQILLNLLNNAIKFTNQGSVTLQVNHLTFQVHPPQSPVSLDPYPGPLLQFKVTDTGVGIAPESLTSIFDAFIQADAGKKAMSGTGLGLTISRKLAELMHGTITLESQPNAGSTFTVTVPVYPTRGAYILTKQPAQVVLGLAPNQPHHRILVVDDQQENRLLLVRLLSQLGLDVQEAANGQEAVQLWQKWHPDLVWMDIRMPGLDGYAATRQIRALEQNPSSIIIALTAQASQSDRALALAAGCNDYVSKPFQAETIFAKMAEYLDLAYVYAEPVTSPGAPDSSVPPSTPTTLPPLDLSALPDAWLAQVEEAAMCGNDRAIAQLITQLSPALTPVATDLMELANQYQFETIITLIRNRVVPRDES